MVDGSVSVEKRRALARFSVAVGGGGGVSHIAELCRGSGDRSTAAPTALRSPSAGLQNGSGDTRLVFGTTLLNGCHRLR